MSEPTEQIAQIIARVICSEHVACPNDPCACHKAAIEVVSATAAPRQAEGWQLVPVEPTPEMERAMGSLERGPPTRQWRWIWQELLTAAALTNGEQAPSKGVMGMQDYQRGYQEGQKQAQAKIDAAERANARSVTVSHRIRRRRNERQP